VTLTQESIRAGFPNVLVLPPYYTKEPSEDGLYDYYARLIDGIRDDRLRIYLYHIPQVTAVPITAALIERLRSNYGSIVAGLKDSSGSLESAKSFLLFDDFDVYPSSEAHLSAALAAGCAGVISGSTNVSGEFAQAVLRAPAQERAGLQATVTEIREALQRFPLIPAVKQIQAWRSGDEAWLRMLPPLRPVAASQVAALRSDAERLGLLKIEVKESAARRART
jgi:4-hydroxy-tetrahydrodipicolinate synthase